MIKINHTYLFVCIYLLSTSFVFSQQLNYTLNKDYSWGVDNYYNNKEESAQTFVRPFRLQQLEEIKDSSVFFPSSRIKKEAKEAKGTIELYPLVFAQGGYDLSSNAYLTKDLGIGGNLLIHWKDKFALNFKAFTANGVYNSYTDSIIRNSGVVPGMGYAYITKDDSLHPQYAYDYFSGYVSYSPNKIFNFQLGRDKHFWGDGYRSLFLSDVAAPYPYLKITTNVWKFTYVNLFTVMKDATNSSFKKEWLNKYATFHYLGWNATKRINIGLFESIVWQGSDSTRHRGYEVNYLNPIMFYRPVEYSLGSSDNAYLGLSTKIKLFKKQQLYGQLLFDEFYLKELKAQTGWWANKFAYQIGFKSFDIFKIKHLNFQTEFNYVRPYTYAHASVQQNYSHLNQSLAHPLGANFMESATFVNYRHKRFFVEAKLLYAIYGADSAGTDYGKNIFISYTKREKEYDNFTTQGIKTDLITTSLRGEYILDAQMNLKVELGFIDRVEKTSYYTKHTPYVYLGIKTDLGNLYHDY